MNFERALICISLAMASGSWGCAGATSTMESSPTGAQVYAMSLGGGTPKLIGDTPLVMTGSDLKVAQEGVGPVVLEYRKEGYIPSRMVVTDVSSMELTLAMELQPSTGLEQPDKLNALFDAVFEGQRLARAGRYPDAIEKLKASQKEAPMLSASFELEGAVLYLQKKFKESLDAYTVATKLNPRNGEAIRMRNRLEAQLGVTRAPAAATGGTP